MKRSLVVVVLAALAASGLTASGHVPAAAWDVLAPAPTPRTEVSVVSAGGKVYVLGGIGAQLLHGTLVEIYDPVTNTWDDGPSLPLPLHHAPAVVLGGSKIVVLGGYLTNVFVPTQETWLLDTSLPAVAQAWIPFVAMPTPRGAHAAATDGSTVWVFGGALGITGLQNLAYKMENALDVAPVWTPIANFPSPRDHLTGAYVDGQVYAVGGRRLTLATNTGRMDVYDPVNNAWKQGPDLPTPRGGIASAVASGHLFVFGGEGPAGTFNQAEVFDAAANAWGVAPPMPHARHGLGAATVGNAIYVESGGEQPGFFFSRHNERLRLL